ncbi:MAG: NADP-dependent isocitrate dehydrogenase [Trueperella sp.]|nr:NADP-dependent isocitrate dehydrogenase [Trueperella sp.]
MARIIYTHTDEAPALATVSFLPILQTFAEPAGVQIETRDISLAGRILAAFSDLLPAAEKTSDALAELAELTQDPTANIIKLPNISASVPQLKAAIAELQEQGFAVPDYPEDPATPAEQEARARYDAVKGSAVNPVLREGNSDRRAPRAVKNYARKHPHSMGGWSPDSQTAVATMASGDFRSTEKSVVIEQAGTVEIVLVKDDGTVETLREVPVQAGEIVDSAKMEAAALDEFLAAQVQRAKAKDLLFSVHLKATMMKVSDPVIFGHAVRAFFPQTFQKYGPALADAGLHAADGLGTIFAGLADLPAGAEIRESFTAELAQQPDLYMVNSDTGVTNLHVPSDVIIDASMPAMIRNSGKGWGPDGTTRDTLAVIPDSSYAGVYQTVIADCKAHGAFDPTTMGTVPNVGLMAQKAEEYGSHDKTFVMTSAGTVEVRQNDTALLRQTVKPGDIYRSCQTKDAPIRDWVNLAVSRARESGVPAVFWLDPERAHDQQVRRKVESYLADLDTAGLEILIESPVAATAYTVQRVRAGQDTISVTGNVLRDYLTDLFPIMELGTSAKMLSIVPLLAGGRLFETGAGGSAPKHVAQLVTENHLRWDSLGEFLAVAESLRQYAAVTGNAQAAILADTLDTATERLLEEGKSPQRKVGEPDNRASHVWLAGYWAAALAECADSTLRDYFAPLAAELAENMAQIQAELLAVQGKPADIGGYYRPDPTLGATVMRPSATFNQIIDKRRSAVTA